MIRYEYETNKKESDDLKKQVAKETDAAAATDAKATTT